MRPCPARTGDDLCPPSLPSAFRLLPPSQPAPPPGSKTTFLHGHYLFFVPFSFCKKQSQKPVQNHPSGRPVYITKALGDPRKGGVLAGGGRRKVSSATPARRDRRLGDPLGPLRPGRGGTEVPGGTPWPQGWEWGRAWSAGRGLRGRALFLALLAAGSREVVGVGCWILECKAEGRPGPLSPPAARQPPSELTGGILVPTGSGP